MPRHLPHSLAWDMSSDHRWTHHGRDPNGLITCKETKVRFVRLEKETRRFSRKIARRRSLDCSLARLQVLSSFCFNRSERCRVLRPKYTCNRSVVSDICFACRAIGIPAIISRYCHPINSDAMSSAPPPPCARICRFSDRSCGLEVS